MTSQTFSGSTATQWANRLVYGVMRHWPALVLTPLLIFVTVPLLAPVAMHAGWTGLGRVIYWLYSPFCHQLPQRSWFLFGPKLTYTLAEIQQVVPTTDPWQLRHFYGTPAMGWKVAWSDRMISFYAMTPVFGLLYVALRRVRPSLGPLTWDVLVLTLLPLALDGGAHLINDLFYGPSGGGFRDANLWLAFLTGYQFPSLYAGDHLGTFNWWMRLLTGLLAAWGTAFFVFPWLDCFFRRELARQTASGPLPPVLSRSARSETDNP